MNPNNIPGLTLWVDAADDSTVNNGRVTNGQNVFKIVDKASGVTFRNGYGNFGPSYSFGAVNGKNVITFNYYTSAEINSIQAKGLWAGNLTTMATGTYSLYCVSFPYDNRQRNQNGAGVFSPQRLHLLALINNLPTDVNGYIPHRNLDYLSIGNNTPNQGFSYRERIDFGAGTDPLGLTGSTLFDKVHSLYPDNTTIPPTNNRYIYGKTNIIGVRVSDGAKKLTVLRRDYVSNENFQTRQISRFSVNPNKGFVPAVGGPWLTIGTFMPNSQSRTVEGVPGPIFNPPSGVDFPLASSTSQNVYPFEGHFCELLFFNRVLSDTEANGVGEYLTKKWIG